MDNTILKFLKELKVNNNRDWFNENRSKYEEARGQMVTFIDQLLLKLREIDPSIGPLSSKDTLFRIYRDVRFSKNKSPYKTNFGSFMVKGGRKSNLAGYYIHFDPDGCFVGGGRHRPIGEDLKNIRSEIYYNYPEFVKIISKKKFRETFGELSGEKLTRPPQGFPKDFEGLEMIKLKEFTVFQRFGEKEIVKPGFLEYILGIYKTMKPFNDFLNKALDG